MKVKIIFLTSLFGVFYFYNVYAQSLYLELMKQCLLNLIYEDPGYQNHPQSYATQEFNASQREKGQDWPSIAHTMIGLDGLNNIQLCLEDVIKNKIPGDCIETGVWRGGAVIFMRAILKEHKIKNRTVWVADSFEGFPVPNVEMYPADDYLVNIHNPILSISLETVKNNFAKYGLLDEQVQFLKGWFRDTLPKAPIKKIALLRLDGDLYESTIDALIYLYPKLSVGGYIIIDDYVANPPCAKAVEDYREANNITDQIESAGWSIRYWKKTK